MFASCRALFSIAAGLGMIGASTARADDKKPEKQPAGAEPVKSIVFYLDASKVPPDLLKQLAQMAEKPKQSAEQPSKPLKPAADGGKPMKPMPGQQAKPVKPAPGQPAKPMKPAPEQQAKPMKPVPEQPVKNQKPAAEGGKPVVIQIDASKLPPDLLKQLLQATEKNKPSGEQPNKPVKPAANPVKPVKP